VVHRLRKRGQTLPVLFLSARSNVTDRVKGLNAGADDYLPKPFELEELDARLRALLRRSEGRTQERQQLGELAYDDDGFFLLRDEPLRILQQCLDNMPEGPFKADHPLTTPPPKERTLQHIETLITHFLQVSWGPVMPAPAE
jgi:two-component system response regulator TctD